MWYFDHKTFPNWNGLSWDRLLNIMKKNKNIKNLTVETFQHWQTPVIKDILL